MRRRLGSSRPRRWTIKRGRFALLWYRESIDACAHVIEQACTPVRVLATPISTRLFVSVPVLVQALFDYNAVETDELAFRSGERMVRTHGFRPPSMVESLAFGAQWEVLPTRAKRTIPSCPHTGRVRVARGGLARVRAWRSYRHGTRQLRPPSPERRG